VPAERLQKIIAAAGIASRRKAEELIAGGLVTVNGQTVTELGSRADAAVDHIRVRGKLLHGAESRIYLMLNKPRGYVSTVSDPERRATVMDLIPGVGARVFPIGRLDYNSEGLLLLTNDGDLAQRLTHASFHVPKTYLVKISGKPSEEALGRLRAGVTIHEQHEGRIRQVRTSPARIELIKDAPNPWYEITLTEGRNRQIHRMFEKVGHHVEKIKRVRYGALQLDVEPGEFRALTPVEVKRLQRGEVSTIADPSAPRKQVPQAQEQRPQGKRLDRGEQIVRAQGDRFERKTQSGPRPHGDRPAGRWQKGPRPQGERFERKSQAGPRAQGDRPAGKWQKGPRPQGDRFERNARAAPRMQGDRPAGKWQKGPRPQGERFERNAQAGPRMQGDRPAGKWQKGPRPQGDRFERNAQAAPRMQGDRPAGKWQKGPRPQGDRFQRKTQAGPRAQGDRPAGKWQKGPRAQGDRFERKRQSGPRTHGDRNDGGAQKGPSSQRAHASHRSSSGHKAGSFSKSRFRPKSAGRDNPKRRG
jgi:23S rRNA pseudouridine2605 synthase